MSSDPLRSAIETIRTQLQAELDVQLGAIERQHGDALDRARHEAREEAEARWTSEVARINAEWESRLRAALAEAAGDAERRLAAEAARVRVETEQQTREGIERAQREAALASERTRAELEQALQAERAGRAWAEEAHVARLAELEREIETAHQRADALSAELTELARSRTALEDRARQSAEEAQVLRQSMEAESAARAQIEQQRTSLESALAAARETMAAEAREAQARVTAESRAAERQSQLAAAERLLNSAQAISDARSLSDVLGALVNGAAAEASRAAVLVDAGGELQPFRSAGFTAGQVRSVPADTTDVLRTAMSGGRLVAVTPARAPAFAALLDDRAGLAVPITIGGQAVAVLYADNGLAASPEVPASWPEAVQILCLHASAAIAHLTAVRTTQAMRLMRPPAAKAAARATQTDTDADQAARRYARLLVSEIKLYNESAVRIGREKRDLLNRLRPEIERARRLYEERVPQTVANRARYFEQELKQTLADGDASLLGQQAVFP